MPPLAYAYVMELFMLFNVKVYYLGISSLNFVIVSLPVARAQAEQL